MKMSDNNHENHRNININELQLASGPSNILRTPIGNVRTRSGVGMRADSITNNVPPPLPPSLTSKSYVPTASPYGMGSGYTGGTSLYGLGGLGGYGIGNSLMSYGGYGGYGSYGGYGTYNRFGNSYGGSYLNPNDPENQFIRIAEESSRPAFQSIESLVAAIGNIADMLNSTFFAITSSFRAILGVAANISHLRGVFAQFWQTFAIFRGLTWIYKKLLYWLRISKIDPSTVVFKEAFAAAAAASNFQETPSMPRGHSPWPVIAFISFIFTAPYIIMKLLGNVTNTAKQESQNPKRWVEPIATRVLFDFNARNSSELTVRSGQSILVAPKEIQNTNCLLNTGWVLATIDNVTSGLVPINYIQEPKEYVKQQKEMEIQLRNQEMLLEQQKQEQQIQKKEEESKISNENDKTLNLDNKELENGKNSLNSNKNIYENENENKIEEIMTTLRSMLNNHQNINTLNNNSSNNINGSTPKNLSLSRRSSNSLAIIPENDG